MTEPIEDKFKIELYEKYKACKKVLIPQEQYFETIQRVKAASESADSKSRHDYYLLNKYEVLQYGDIEKLIKKRRRPGESILYYVSIEDTYDIIKRAHLATGHGGRDRMLREIGKKYANITEYALQLFKSYCQECQKKRKCSLTKSVVRPILSNEFNFRGQIDFIDMQTMAYKSYKWIFVYQDLLTKFVILRALTSKRATEVAHHLLDIFLLFGAPSILQSDNGSEFTAEVINELRLMWPKLVLIHGNPHNPQSQESVECANGDIKDMLVAWMSDNQTNEWPKGIKFVQFSKNSSLHSGIKRSPYAAMFGHDVKVGLTSSSLPNEIIDCMQSEDDLVSALAPAAHGELPRGLCDMSQEHYELPQEPQELPQEHRELPHEPQELLQEAQEQPLEPGELPQECCELPQEHHELPQEPQELLQEPREQPLEPGELTLEPGELPQECCELPQEHHELPQEPHEIMDLPLHMEGRHLAFYREVSLVLRGDDIQRTKVYTCGECGKKIQGTVSIVQHLLAHDSDIPKPGTTRYMTVLNGGENKDGEQLLVNGDHKSEGDGGEKSTVQPSIWMMQSRLQNGSEEEKKYGDDEISHDKLSVTGTEFKLVKRIPISANHESIPVSHTLDCGILLQNGSRESEMIENGSVEESLSYSGTHQEPVQVEINPLDLLTTVIEEDQKSEHPILPAEHFLLSLPTPTHFLEGEGGGLEDSADGFQDGQENEDDGSNDGFSDIPSDILLDHPGVYHCDKCEETFKYQHLLVTHKHQVHQSLNVPYECQVCGMEYGVLQELKRHMMTHSGANVYTCNMCSQGFADRASLKTHALSHGGSTERSNKCESCACEFPSKSELTRHIVKYQGTCNPNKSEGVRCATCGEDLPNLEALKDHRRTAHPTPEVTAGSAKKGFECDYCGKTFNCRSNLRDHLVVHTGEKPYPCDICGKSFSFIHNMKTHRLTHNEGRNEVCPYCDKAYKSKISLYYHMKKGNCRGLSTKEVPEGYHRCTECLQMFASEERFKSHKEKGHCQVSHRCQYCGLRCSTEARLQNHLQKGICQKKESSHTSNSSDAPKRRRSLGKEREKPQEEIVCDRCNYTKDCCCTFSCNHCGKRVFSIMAYTMHSERTCPVLKHRRERIRMAIMEKRRRREGLAPSTKELPEPETYTGTRNRYHFHADYLGLGKGRHIDRKDVKRKIAEVRREDVKRKEVVKKKITEVGTRGPEEGDGDDSSSGSLTDLSTFTSPNILQPVTDPTDE